MISYLEPMATNLINSNLKKDNDAGCYNKNAVAYI